MKKDPVHFCSKSLIYKVIYGRGERIRTFDPLVPNQMRYQAALRPDLAIVMAPGGLFAPLGSPCRTQIAFFAAGLAILKASLPARKLPQTV